MHVCRRMLSAYVTTYHGNTCGSYHLIDRGSLKQADKQHAICQKEGPSHAQDVCA
jgi:hypothetical protein